MSCFFRCQRTRWCCCRRCCCCGCCCRWCCCRCWCLGSSLSICKTSALTQNQKITQDQLQLMIWRRGCQAASGSESGSGSLDGDGDGLGMELVLEMEMAAWLGWQLRWRRHMRDPCANKLHPGWNCPIDDEIRERTGEYAGQLTQLRLK